MSHSGRGGDGADGEETGDGDPRMGYAVEMSDGEIEAFLGTGGTGTLSFAREGDAYSVPVSYGFDPGGGAFYFRLAAGPDSEKDRYIEATRTASFVVARESDAGWRSVVARGRLDEVPEASIDSTVVDAIRTAEIPFVTIFDRPAREMEFALYRLRPDDLTGRKEADGR